MWAYWQEKIFAVHESDEYKGIFEQTELPEASASYILNDLIPKLVENFKSFSRTMGATNDLTLQNATEAMEMLASTFVALSDYLCKSFAAQLTNCSDQFTAEKMELQEHCWVFIGGKQLDLMMDFKKGEATIMVDVCKTFDRVKFPNLSMSIERLLNAIDFVSGLKSGGMGLYRFGLY